jgi:hypothetical protein
MKTILTSLLVLALFGCQDKLESNTPAFQGLKDANYLWKSTASTAVVDATGVLTITGVGGLGTLTLIVPSTTLGPFVLGADATALAMYAEEDLLFSTLNNGNGSSIYVSDGTITIEEYDTVSGTITASFYFNAYNADGDRGLNFSEGIIYKLPVTTVIP